jgi:lysine 2,3-aminomutase
MEKIKKHDSFAHKPQYYQNIESKMWKNWRWQQENMVKTIEQLQNIYPNFPEKYACYADAWMQKQLKFNFTPYILSLIEHDADGNPLLTDPIWKQFFPTFDELTQNKQSRADEYSSLQENWENKKEMLTPICQWKYTNRVIIYSIDACLSSCVYCLRSMQVKADEERHGGMLFWDKTIQAIKANKNIEEVVLSGGDPLLYPNSTLEKMFFDLCGISTIKSIRINTRALTHNPYKIDDIFCSLLEKYDITALGIHINHQNEITNDFILALNKIQKKTQKTIFLAQTVLVKGVNNDEQTLKELFKKLYFLGIKPYYLFHNMPNIPAAASQRTTVQKGVKLIKGFKRHISNPAVPEYIIAHKTGKKTVPLEIEGTPEFKYTVNKNGLAVVKFKNWKNKWVEYVDGID